ncbi:MAG: YncE family protein, partial [Planctomycetes bacterium]|nr:YncE family protein [Planctomycetota bacterium]
MKQIAANPISLVLILFIAVSAAPLAAGSDYLSPLAIVADAGGETLYIAEVTAHQIAVFDPAEQKVAKTISLPDTPTGLVLSPDGTKLYVTGDGAKGKVHIIDTASAKVTGSIAVGNGPTGPAISPDDKTLYVCNQFDNDVSVIDLAAGKETGRISGASQPVAAAVTPDGRHLLIADLVPNGSADTNYTAAKVTIVATAGNKVIAEIGLLNGSTGLRRFAVTPDSKFAYVTHILGRYQLPTTQLERGWMNTNALSIIDIENGKLFNTVLLDDVDLGAANPWAVVLTDNAEYICVTHAGTHEISVIDRAGLHEKLDKIEAGEKVSNVSARPEDVPNDLSFLVDLRRRIKL